MAGRATAGALFQIGGTGALVSESSWVTVGEVTQIPEFGKTFAQVNASPIGSGRTLKFKGSHNLGDPVIQYVVDETDTGQDALTAALADKFSDYNFRILLDDDPVTTDGEGSNYTFRGKVFSNPLVFGGADDAVMRNASIGIVDDEITYTAAT